METKKKKSYNPRKFARKVRGTETLLGGVQGFKTKSWTRDDDTIQHEGNVDTETGAVICTCEHFEIKLARLLPNWLRPQTWCKHIERRLQRLEEKGEIPNLAARQEADRAARLAQFQQMRRNGEFDDIID